jgi:hypothetical protein
MQPLLSSTRLAHFESLYVLVLPHIYIQFGDVNIKPVVYKNKLFQVTSKYTYMSASSLSVFQPLDQTNHVRDLATMNDPHQ